MRPPVRPYKNESAKSDVLEMQQTVAEQPKSVLLQVVNAAWSLESDNAVSSLPREPTESFESRWSGLQRSESGVEFNARWALDSQ